MTRQVKIALLVLLLVAAGFWLWRQRGSPESVGPASLVVGEAKISVEIADEPAEQIRGLSRREELCESCGMLFVFAEASVQRFWMQDMKFPLDMIFIRDGRIVEIAENVPAPVPAEALAVVQSSQSADQVLEVNAGFAQTAGLGIGDRIDLTP